MIPIIAIVEDDVAVRDVMSAVLADAGFAVLMFAHGNGAYDLIRRAQPEVVILDVWLDDQAMGGLLVEALDNDPATGDIPVILCSADVQILRDLTPHLRPHGRWVLEKPFSLDKLLTLVHEALPFGLVRRKRRDGAA